ncbi:MAG: nucleotidyltransferase domain-containing protein [Clostridiales bacterium]|nr:nucleotidyltransferase domain-containing protein [Clostridiales bacterium]
MDEAIKRELEIIKEGVLQTVPAEAIYLFGSFAYGTPHKDSDLDIYVVVPDSVEKNPIDIGTDILRSLRYKKINMPMDLMVGKASVFARRKEGVTIQREIAQRGVMLHGQ